MGFKKKAFAGQAGKIKLLADVLSTLFTRTSGERDLILVLGMLHFSRMKKMGFPHYF